MGYLGNFIVYTFAMVGVIVIALLVFKNSTSVGVNKKSKYLKVIDTMSLAPRKNLYIVSAGEEKFLIAGDVDKTTLISKLENVSSNISLPVEKGFDELYVQKQPIKIETVQKTFQDTMSGLAKSNEQSYMDKSNIGINSSILSSNNQTAYTSVIRNIAEKMRG